MPKDDVLKKGTSITLNISLDEVTYHDFLDVGFTRNFASSQAFLDKFPKDANMDKIGPTIIPSNADEGLDFKKMKGNIYQWMGFEASDLMFGFLNEMLKDKKVTLDVFAYDLNEPDIVAKPNNSGRACARSLTTQPRKIRKATSPVTARVTAPRLMGRHD